MLPIRLLRRGGAERSLDALPGYARRQPDTHQIHRAIPLLQPRAHLSAGAVHGELVEAVAAALPLLERLAREPAYEQPPQDLPGLRDVPVESARTFAAWRPGVTARALRCRRRGRDRRPVLPDLS